jgi:hypothetical protein
MKKLIYLISLWFILFISFSSCEKTIEFKGETSDPKLVVYSVITEDSIISIYLTASRPVTVFEDKVQRIDNAEVNLYIDGAFAEKLNYKPSLTSHELYELSQYISESVTPEPGKIYSIEVSVPGYSTVSAQCQLPEIIPILNLDTVTVFISEYDYSYSSLETKLRFRDPPGVENYYRLVTRSKLGIYQGDKSIPYSNENPVRILHSYEYQAASTNDPLLVNREDENLIGDGIWNEYYIFSDELISGKEYDLSFAFQNYSYDNYGGLDPAYYEFRINNIQLQSISRELYLYLKSTTAHRAVMDDLFSEPVLVYSNVENGIGIFAAYSASNTQIKIGEYPVEGVNYDTPGYYD